MAPIIIIGAGLAGWTTVREFRKLDSNTPVVMITADQGDFYAKPSLSNAFAQKRTPAQLVSTPGHTMAQTHKVTLHTHTRVQSIDPVARTVRTAQGEVWAYEKLVLATGAQPVRFALAGNAADQALSINSLEDFAVFHQRITELQRDEKHVLIMGAGLIGCEFANDLAGAGYRVSVVDPAAVPLQALLPPAAGTQLQTSLATLGVQWHLGSTVKAVSHSADPHGGALQIELSNGVVLSCDAVLSAIGLRADMTLAKAAGLACERAVVVDARLQTSAPHIYALGDVAQYASAGARGLPYVMPIMTAAKALASSLTGTPSAVVFPLMPISIKTPALPIVVAAPAPATPGAWHSVQEGVWQFKDDTANVRGFVLTGQQTAQRVEQSKLITST